MFVLEKAFHSQTGIPPSHENSNNPLAVKPESENDAACLNFAADTFEISLRAKRRLPAATTGFIQMIDTLTRATKLGPLLAVAAIFAAATPARREGSPLYLNSSHLERTRSTLNT
ncbi:hypothetical protein ACFIOY_03330 [Bradyrhizobium sp. TZ2]